MSQLSYARAYVQSRFYPPLPTVYGDLLVLAVERCREGNEHEPIKLPDALNPLPAAAWHEDGAAWVDPSELVRILRCEHAIWGDFW